MSDETKNVINQLAAAIGSAHHKAPSAFLDESAPFESEQRTWLNGLLTGLNAIAVAAQGDASEGPGTPLTILYGSQSGNAEALSKDLRKYAKAHGFEATIGELDAVDPSDLASIKHLLVICSTFGEGEPPDNAKSFYKAMTTGVLEPLPATLNFTVCGLGDSSYAYFNKCAQDIDAKVAELGATRVADFVACDVAFEDDYVQWKTAAFTAEAFVSAAGAVSGVMEPEEAGPKYDKNNPFLATLMASENLSGVNSAKRVNHIEISLAGGTDELDYAVGDALGVWPVNCPQEVQAILTATGLTGKESVQLKSGPASLRAALLTKLDLCTVNAKTLEVWAVAAHEAFQVLDTLKAAGKPWNAQLLVDGLRPLQPRLYSIASSPKAHPGEVHLTVGEVHYDLLGSARKGVASTFLGNRLGAGGTVGVYLQRSAHFHIPANDDAPLIMIGPGTGIAPFRAFLEEREARRAKGKNWLFFGDQHEAEDYLYRNQITEWQNSLLLTHLSLAWSRDTSEKIYVQTLIKKQGAEFFAWLQEGGYIYICGDASRMAADVDKALRQVIAEHGHLDDVGVQTYVDKLVAEHRYQRDVY